MKDKDLTEKSVYIGSRRALSQGSQNTERGYACR